MSQADVLVFQQGKTTLNSYQAGVDFKLLSRINVSHHQFVHDYKGDTSWADRSCTAAGQPCAVPISDPRTIPPTASPACDGCLEYSRAGRELPIPANN